MKLDFKICHLLDVGVAFAKNEADLGTRHQHILGLFSCEKLVFQ